MTHQRKQLMQCNHVKHNQEDNDRSIKMNKKTGQKVGQKVGQNTGLMKPRYWVSTFIASVCLLGMINNSFAVEKPRSLASDQRIKVVAFDPNNVVPVHANTFTSTQLIFSKNEYIKDIQNGDLDAWTASVQKGLGNMVFIKPTILGSNTNMTVVTNLHTYYFHLMSNKKTNDNAMDNVYAIRFSYPRQAQANLRATLKYNAQQKRALLNAHRNPQDYNWSYSFNGSRSIVPLHIFDDGKFTYMQLRSDQSVPAVFAVHTKAGDESVVNFRRQGQYLVIQQVAPQFTLRQGKNTVASIFNNRLINQRNNESAD